MERQLGRSTLENDARRLLTWIREQAGGLTHNVLSATHPDTIAGAVTRGALIVGESTPKWNPLALGAAYTHLESDGSDLAYQANLTLADDAWIGLGAAAGRVIFDSTPAPDQVQLAAADLYLPASHGIIHADGVTAGYVLRADGTRYVPADPATTVPLAPVAQGDLIIADGTPAWSVLTLAAAAGYALVSTATTAVWDQTPTWTGGHTWDDGAGDSPAIKFVGGSNDDTIAIFLDDDATAGRSDLIIKLVDAGGYSKLIVQDSGGTERMSVSSDGELDVYGRSAFGDNASIPSQTVVNVDQIETSPGPKYGVYSILRAQPTGTIAGNYVAVHGSARLETAQTFSDELIGISGRAAISSGVAGSPAEMYGGSFNVDAEDGTATLAVGVRVYTPIVDTGEATTGVGVYIIEGTIGAGSIPTLYGMYIDDIDGGTTNYAVYTNDGECRFGDDVDIAGVLMLRQEAEPADPPEDAGVLWCSNGTGTGDPGDLVYKTKEGGVTKTEIVVDFSAI